MPRRNNNQNPPVDVPPPYEQAVAAAPANVPAPVPGPDPAPQPVVSKVRKAPLPEDVRAIIVRHYIPEFERIVREHEPADLSATSPEVGKWKKSKAVTILQLIQDRKEPFDGINNRMEDMSEKDIREVSVLFSYVTLYPNKLA